MYDMFHRKLRFSLGEAQSICQCVEHACIWCIYIYIYTHTNMVKHTYTSAHPYIHCIVYVSVYVYIYISLSLSLFFYCLYMHMVSIGFPSHSDGFFSPSPRLWTAYRHELKRLPPRWLPGTGCAMPVCPGYGWHGMLVGWKMGFDLPSGNLT